MHDRSYVVKVCTAWDLNTNIGEREGVGGRQAGVLSGMHGGSSTL